MGIPRDPRTEHALRSVADMLLSGTAGSPPGPEGDDGTDAIAFPTEVPSTAPGQTLHELVLVGSVPGYGGAWLTQYGWTRWQSRQPIALLRLDRQAVEVESFGEPIGCEDAALNEAVKTFTGAGVRIALAPRGDGQGLIRAAARQMEHWTILTGADEACVMACYQLIKGLVADDGVGPTGGIGLVLVGCEQATARSAAQRLARACEQYLGVRVELSCVLPRIDRVQGRWVTRLKCGDRPWESVAQALGLNPESDPHDEPVQLADPVEPRATGQATQAPGAKPAERAQPSLADYVSGLKGIQARCPRIPEAELALDPAGRLHVLYGGRAGERAESAILKLIDAQQWCSEHRELIAMACHGTNVDTAAEPQAHLFTNRPRSVLTVSAFAPAARCPLALHLLKAVEVGGATHYLHEQLL